MLGRFSFRLVLLLLVAAAFLLSAQAISLLTEIGRASCRERV